MAPLIPATLLGTLAVLLTSTVSLGQSIPADRGDAANWPRPVWPRPVQNVQHVEVASGSTWMTAPELDQIPFNALRATSPPHHVIVSPNRLPAKHPHASQHASTHPPHFSHHRRVQPSPAVLPQANRRTTWKSPYSYGYFGASSTRHWTKHHGYRDSYKEWRLR